MRFLFECSALYKTHVARCLCFTGVCSSHAGIWLLINLVVKKSIYLFYCTQITFMFLNKDKSFNLHVVDIFSQPRLLYHPTFIHMS